MHPAAWDSKIVQRHYRAECQHQKCGGQPNLVADKVKVKVNLQSSLVGVYWREADAPQSRREAPRRRLDRQWQRSSGLKRLQQGQDSHICGRISKPWIMA